MSVTLPDAIVATTADLPPAVAAALDGADPTGGIRRNTTAAGIPFSSIAWGDPRDRPLVLIHGISASSRIWWRVGPALAATSRHVVAVDLPGHGLTGHWGGRHRFRETAADVAAWIRATGLDVPELQVVGHSWGAMTTAALPSAAIRPATLVLVDPPAMPHDVMSRMAVDTSELPHGDLETTVETLAAVNPTWFREDVWAKAEGLIQVDLEAPRAVLIDNVDWDGGLADLADPAAAGIPTWIVRGDPAAGSLLPDASIRPIAELIGPDHVLTLAGAPHSPQRTHPAATTIGLLRALG